MLAAFCLAVFFHVHGLLLMRYMRLMSSAVLQVGLLYLQLYQLAGKRNYANVVPRVSLYGNDVTLSESRLLTL